MIQSPAERALRALDALSVGDAFGERFFYAPAHLILRTLPPSPWGWTDDTQMALSVTEVLLRFGHIDQDALADAFAARYEPGRGYGAGAHHLMEQLRVEHWSTAAPALFDGRGSWGNGGAMRVAPLGAFLADADDHEIAAQARRSAEVTHAHPWGQDGAVAVALAAAALWRDPGCDPDDLFGVALEHVPTGKVAEGIARARQLPAGAFKQAVSELGTGSRVSAQDTAPFCIWMAAHHRAPFEDVLWLTAEGLGDVDTTCAIVAGLIAPCASPPAAWLAAREPLPPLPSPRS